MKQPAGKKNLRDKKLARRSWWEGKVTFINGIRIDKPFVLLVLGCVLATLIIGLSIFGSLYLKKAKVIENAVDNTAADESSEEASPAVEESLASELDESLPTIDAVLRRHSIQTGLPDSTSFIIEGEYETQGLIFELVAISKRGGYVRQSLKYEDLEIQAGWNGEAYWENNPLSKLKEKAIFTRFVNAAMLSMQASPAALAWQYAEEGTENLLWIGRGDVDSVRCDVIRNQGMMEFPVYHFLSAETGLELRREVALVYESTEVPIRVDFIYGGSSAVDGSSSGIFQDGYILYLGGSLIAEASYRRVRPNSGAVSWMFDPVEVQE